MSTGNIRSIDANSALDTLVNNWGTLSLALSTTQPVLSNGDIVGYTEPSGGSYARASVPTSSWAPAANRVKVTDTDIDFPAPTGNWGYVGYVVAFTAAGTPVFYGTLTQALNIVTGGQDLRIGAGTLSIAFPAN